MTRQFPIACLCSWVCYVGCLKKLLNDDHLIEHMKTLNVLSDPKSRPDRNSTELKEATEYVGKWMAKNDKQITKLLPAATIAFSRLYVMAFNVLSLHAAFTDKKWFAEQVPESTSEDRAFKNWKSDPKDLTKLGKAVATMILEKKEQSKSADDRNSAATLFNKAAKDEEDEEDDGEKKTDDDSSHDGEKDAKKKKAKKDKEKKNAKDKKDKDKKQKKENKKRKKKSSSSSSDNADAESSNDSEAKKPKDDADNDVGKKRKKEKAKKSDAKGGTKTPEAEENSEVAKAVEQEGGEEFDYSALDKKDWEQMGEKLEKGPSLDDANELLKEIPEPIREKHNLPEEATEEDLEASIENMKAAVAAAISN